MSSTSPIARRIQSEAVKRAASNFLGMKHFSWYALVAAMLFFLGAGWIPDSITNLLLPNGNKLSGCLQLTASTLIFCFFGWLVHHKIEEAEKMTVSVTTPDPVRVLVVFLSNLMKNDHERELLTSRPDSLETLVTALLGTPWEMPYLAVAHHASRLESLYVITSNGDKGSQSQFAQFKTIMGKLFPSIATIESIDENGMNYEDISQVHKVIDTFYDKYDQSSAYAKQDVIVDITGGKKPNSIAAAMATLAEGRRFQYVSTEDKQVLSYDLVITG